MDGVQQNGSIMTQLLPKGVKITNDDAELVLRKLNVLNPCVYRRMGMEDFVNFFPRFVVNTENKFTWRVNFYSKEHTVIMVILRVICRQATICSQR